MKKIVLVDDEPDICEGLSELLRDAGYQTFAAHRGFKGLELIKSEKPDLVILDISLPDMDGTVIYDHIRTDPFLQTIKVIFLTALATGAPEQFAGIDRPDYTIISKPVKFETLLKEVERLLHM